MKNIEETEKAKRAAAERKEGKRRADDEFLAATRCESRLLPSCQVGLILSVYFLVYKPTGKHKSDADIIRDAKLEAMGIRPEDVERRHQHRDKTLTATDEIVSCSHIALSDVDGRLIFCSLAGDGTVQKENAKIARIVHLSDVYRALFPMSCYV